MVLAAAHRRLQRGKHRPAISAILNAVEAGVRDGRRAGWQRARELFPQLLFSDVCRRRLALLPMLARPAAEPWLAKLTIGAALRQTARRFPDRDAMVFPQAGVRMTWAEFDRGGRSHRPRTVGAGAAARRPLRRMVHELAGMGAACNSPRPASAWCW